MDWNFERVKGMGDCIGGSLTSRQRAFVVSFVPIGCLRWGWGTRCHTLFVLLL
jgi:hypothetical protein